MKYVIASSAERTLRPWIQGLDDLPNLEFRVGNIPPVGEGCDAEIVAFMFAHDRYGGTPRIGEAQALVNHLQDGSPRIILATPPLPLESLKSENESSGHGANSIEEHVFRTVRACVDEAERLNREDSPGSPIRCILLHIIGLGFDRFKAEPALKGFRRAIRADFKGSTVA